MSQQLSSENEPDSINRISNYLKNGTVPMDEMRNLPGQNYVNILLLRELESHAIFTTDGENADLATISIPGADDGRAVYTPGLMFMRKQTGSDRRTGKAMMRELLNEEDTMDVNEMNPTTVESALYGSAASTSEFDASVTSRVRYDTAYTVRSADEVVESKFQNATGEGVVKEANENIFEPDYFAPGTLFPSVITLRDATPAEVLFVLAITQQNKRYGAATSRLGRVNNHVLDIYAGNEEGPSNLAITRDIIRRFVANGRFDSIDAAVNADVLSVDDAKRYARQAYRAVSGGIVEQERLDPENTEELLNLTELDSLAPVLEAQADRSKKFITNYDED